MQPQYLRVCGFLIAWHTSMFVIISSSYLDLFQNNVLPHHQSHQVMQSILNLRLSYIKKKCILLYTAHFFFFKNKSYLYLRNVASASFARAWAHQEIEWPKLYVEGSNIFIFVVKRCIATSVFHLLKFIHAVTTFYTPMHTITPTHGQQPELLFLGSLSTHGFDTWMATGSELFLLLTCPHTTAFTLLSIFSPLEASGIKSGRQYGPSTRNDLFRLPSASQKRTCLSSLN